MYCLIIEKKKKMKKLMKKNYSIKLLLKLIVLNINQIKIIIELGY